MQKIIKILLAVFILIEPILDNYYLYNTAGLEIMGFRIFTIIRYGLIGVLGILLILKTKLKKHRPWIIAYVLLLMVYIGFHAFNALHFKSLVPGNFNYSLVKEIFYITRYFFPLFLVYFIYCIGMEKKDFKRTVVILSLIISLSVIISNIFYLSRSSYYDYTISYNIIEWFYKDISYANASTRGFFYATIIITNLLILTPYIYYLYYKEGKYLYLFTIIANMLALFMAGTKACTFGFIMLAIAMLLLYLFFTIIKKERKLNWSRLIATVVILLASLFILPKSPAVQRIYLSNDMYIDKDKNDALDEPILNDEPTEEIPDDNLNEIDSLEDINLLEYHNFKEIYDIEDKDLRRKTIKKYIYANMDSIGISKNLIKAYSFKYDYEFWADIILKETNEMKANNRNIEKKIFDRIKYINNNKMDDYFGITYSRTTKIFNLERDFLYQYYSLGIVGVIILLMPIVVLLLISMLFILKKKENFNMENCSLCLGIGMILCVAFYSGNVLDNLGITIILGYVLGYLIYNVFKENKKSKIEEE